jgi:hypothetical protein
VSNQATLELFQGTNDTLEGSSDIGEVGDATADDEDLAVRVWGAAGDEVNCSAAQSSWSRKTKIEQAT